MSLDSLETGESSHYWGALQPTSQDRTSLPHTHRAPTGEGFQLTDQMVKNLRMFVVSKGMPLPRAALSVTSLGLWLGWA